MMQYKLSWEMVSPFHSKEASTVEVTFDDHDPMSFSARVNQYRQLKKWADAGEEGILWVKLEKTAYEPKWEEVEL